MKKKMLFALITAMSISLVGIILVQVFWIQRTIDAKKAQFSFNARQSLITVAKEIKNHEINRWYTKISAMADSSRVPDETRFSRLFHLEKNNITNQTYILTNGILQEDYKLRSPLPGSENDSIHFKKLVSRKVTFIRKGDLSKEIGNTSRKQVAHTKRLKGPEKLLLINKIKDLADKEPIYERISSGKLKRLIDKQLKIRGITSAYDFGIFSDGLATKVSSGKFNRGSQASYGISVFPSTTTDYKLYIHFGNKKEEIYSAISWMAGLSIALIFVIILTYIGAIYQLLKQRRISEIKTDFINNMTHEFKTPIATINLALDSVSNPKIAEDADKRKSYLKMIRDENHRMHAQVENVLRISRLERHDLDINKERLQLNDLIDEAITHVDLIVQNRSGYIKKHYGALKCSVLANESHFVNVIVNILDNAVKYSEDAPKIDVFTENGRDNIILKIRDQGKGMSKTAQKKVFEKFYREHTGDLHNVKGHGLGLAYVQKIVSNHQGEISVESEKGKGSTFIIKLPLIT